MPSFPKLKTGAVAQYPAHKAVRFSTQVLRFLDGSDQRYRGWAGPLCQWQIALRLLDEQEMRSVEQFFEENAGCFGNFEFTDPWDGQVYPNCSLASDQLPLDLLAELRGATTLTVLANRT